MSCGHGDPHIDLTRSLPWEPPEIIVTYNLHIMIQLIKSVESMGMMLTKWRIQVQICRHVFKRWINYVLKIVYGAKIIYGYWYPPSHPLIYNSVKPLLIFTEPLLNHTEPLQNPYWILTKPLLNLYWTLTKPSLNP